MVTCFLAGVLMESVTVLLGLLLCSTAIAIETWPWHRNSRLEILTKRHDGTYETKALKYTFVLYYMYYVVSCNAVY